MHKQEIILIIHRMAVSKINNQEKVIICIFCQTRNLGRLGRVGSGARMEAVGTKCKITIGKPEGNREVGRPRCILAYKKKITYFNGYDRNRA
jgi:hypothetical protein